MSKLSSTNLRRLFIGLVTVSIMVAVFVVYRDRIERWISGQNSVELQGQPQSVAVLPSSESPKPSTARLDTVSDAGELSRLREDNRELRRRLEQAEKNLSTAERDKAVLKTQIEEVLRPTRQDVVSSTLKTSVGAEETLLTGGYQTADGRYQFTAVQPQPVQLPDGRTAIKLQCRQFALTPEDMNNLKLNSLSTTAGNTIQHGEVWKTDDLIELYKKLSTTDGAAVLTAPTIITLPGQPAQFSVGQYQMNTTAQLSEDGTHVDLDMRVEQPRNPNSADNSDTPANP